MFDEPSESPAERAIDPAVRAKEKSDEFRMHAELCAVFEGCRKFDAQIMPKLDAKLAREVQRIMGRLEKSKSAEHPVLPEGSAAESGGLLTLPQTRSLTTNDYHIYRRPGEVMIARWLAGDQVEAFYTRFQAHFDVALNQFREEERQSQGWKQDPATLKYLKAIDSLEIRMADRYLRDLIRMPSTTSPVEGPSIPGPVERHNLFVLSTQAADELDILHLCDYVMGVEAADVVGASSAPPEEPTERDRAWFFKLFSLRGMIEGVERMCFFAYLQKTEEEAW